MPGSMGAFFSSTDTSDDQRDRFSAVFSSIHKLIPECKFRFSSAGKFTEYELDDLFEERAYNINFDIYEAIKKVTLIEYRSDIIKKDKNFENFGFFPRHRDKPSWYDIMKKMNNNNISLSTLYGVDW